MTITARYASTCPTCSQRITPGQSVEWVKGSPARHTTCGAAPEASTAATRRPYRPTTCEVCGHVERRDRRGYPIGDRILRSGECQSCYEERKMGY